MQDQCSKNQPMKSKICIRNDVVLLNNDAEEKNLDVTDKKCTKYVS